MKFFIAFALTVAACAISTAYAERSLEQMIADHQHVLEVLGEHYQIQSLRAKRSKDKEFEHETCCGTGQHALTNAETNAIEKCNHHLHDDGDFDEMKGKDEKMMEKFDCYMLCYGDVTGICSATGDVNKAAMEEELKRHYPEPEVKDLVGKLCPICIDGMTKYAKDNNNGKCCKACGHSVACILHLVDCMCPKKLQVQSNECEALRKEFKDMMEKNS